MKKRTATIKRKTKETDITVKLDIDGSGKSRINTGIGILDHMLELFAFHGLFDLDITAKGDLKVDIHHTNEDVGIVLGQVFKKALQDKDGKIKHIRRSGFGSWPMEEVVANVNIDICGRGYFSWPLKGAGFAPDKKYGYNIEYAQHFLDAFAKNLAANLNIMVGTVNPDLHITLEPIFKALGVALDQATQIDPRRKGVPSSKGVID